MIRIVVVDDEKVDRYIVRRLIKRLDHLDHEVELVEFEAGDHFVEAMGDPERRAGLMDGVTAPLLVLLDINMPRMDGFEVLEALSRLEPEGLTRDMLVVTMYTSSAHAEDQDGADRSSLVREFVVKPITKERLGDLVEALVEGGFG